ncbi:ribonuclease HII [Carboxydothermus pertinax]|uniref:Ribonuclease HII n=1 Tax=Carboxydothermus pertinax TaxID=870242 RepID=A0A1L8CXT2_9THEO|nr:ribonuclease HII [Carboxydothermus pertinax]GAV23669.1 ribonuclease HII [Carboxydothermus pertinax]
MKTFINNLPANLQIENNLFLKGHELVGGGDEAGRGPVAGPVVAAIVVIKPGIFIPGVDDSKLLSAQKRKLLFKEIINVAEDWSVAVVEPELIDRFNIYQATRFALKAALLHLNVKPSALILDALKIDGFSGEQIALAKADHLSFTVACASIIAKVVRDRIMEQYDKIYPGYDFKKNKGYLTAQHRRAIKKLGPTPIHRKSFEPIKSFYSQMQLFDEE